MTTTSRLAALLIVALLVAWLVASVWSPAAAVVGVLGGVR